MQPLNPKPAMTTSDDDSNLSSSEDNKPAPSRFPSAREAARHYLKKLDQHRRSQQAATSSAKTPALAKP